MQNLTPNDPNDKELEGVILFQFAALLAFIGLIVTIILFTPWGRIFQ